MATTPKRLNHRHELVALLAARGMRRAQIAQQLGYYPTTLSAIMRAPAFREKLVELQARVRASVIERVVAQIVNGTASNARSSQR